VRPICGGRMKIYRIVLFIGILSISFLSAEVLFYSATSEPNPTHTNSGMAIIKSNLATSEKDTLRDKTVIDVSDDGLAMLIVGQMYDFALADTGFRILKTFPSHQFFTGQFSASGDLVSLVDFGNEYFNNKLYSLSLVNDTLELIDSAIYHENIPVFSFSEDKLAYVRYSSLYTDPSDKINNPQELVVCNFTNGSKIVLSDSALDGGDGFSVLQWHPSDSLLYYLSPQGFAEINVFTGQKSFVDSSALLKPFFTDHGNTVIYNNRYGTIFYNRMAMIKDTVYDLLTLDISPDSTKFIGILWSSIAAIGDYNRVALNFYDIEDKTFQVSQDSIFITDGFVRCFWRSLVDVQIQKQAPHGVGSVLTSSPNPFNPATAISYAIPGNGQAELGIYSLAGKLVYRTLVSGSGSFVWDASDQGSGVYVCRLEAAGKVMARRMVCLK